MPFIVPIIAALGAGSIGAGVATAVGIGAGIAGTVEAIKGPAKPPPAPNAADFTTSSNSAGATAAQAQRVKAANAGRAATILTSPLGVPGGGTPTQQKTLLGQ